MEVKPEPRDGGQGDPHGGEVELESCGGTDESGGASSRRRRSGTSGSSGVVRRAGFTVWCLDVCV
jgi:hypothetical protein